MDKCKKKPALLIAALCFGMMCSAQKVMLGLQAAPLISWNKADSKNLESKGTKMGFSYGLIADFKLAERYFFGTGVQVTYMGGKLNIPIALSGAPAAPVSNTTIDYSLQYIQVPLTLKFRTKEIGNFAYWAQFGYGNSFLLKARASLHSEDNKINEDKHDINSESSRLNYDYRVPVYRGSLIVGLGMEYPIGGNSRISLGLRYDNGFFDIVRDSRLTATNSNLGLNIGMIF